MASVFLFCKETSSATYFFWVFAVLLGNFLSLFGSGDDNMERLKYIFSTIANHHVQFHHHHHQQHHLGLEARSAAWARDFAPAVADEEVDEDFFTTDFNSFELLLSFSSKLVLVCNCRRWLISKLSTSSLVSFSQSTHKRRSDILTKFWSFLSLTCGSGSGKSTLFCFRGKVRRLLIVRMLDLSFAWILKMFSSNVVTWFCWQRREFQSGPSHRTRQWVPVQLFGHKIEMLAFGYCNYFWSYIKDKARIPGNAIERRVLMHFRLKCYKLFALPCI